MSDQEPAPSGILLIDKALDWTSHDAVARTRRLAHTRKVGHAGTLDPAATGLLVLGIGSATRLLGYVVGADKEYFATIRLGASTTTDDAEGETLAAASPDAVEAVDDARLRDAIAGSVGTIDQVPSSVSAIKVDGKRAYARVRAGEDVELKSREVTIAAFDVVGAIERSDGRIDVPVRVECSSGTYIRALARDLGARLGVGGHLTSLRRTRVGPFRVEDAATLDALDDESVPSRVLGPADAASLLFSRIELDERQAVDLGHGKRIALSDEQLGEPGDAPRAAIAPSGRLVGLLRVSGRTGVTLVGFPADA